MASIDEADLLDDVFMNLVASDPEVGEAFCRRLLSVLLEKEIGKVNVLVQRVLPGVALDLRGVRLDVEVTEESEGDKKLQASVYDIEPHTSKEASIAKMMRFRQAKIDSRYMKSGDNDFKHLPDLYVIMISNFDPFDKGYMLYTIRNKCDELPDLEYKDGLRYLYFYTKGTNGGSITIGNMLKYLQNSRRISAVDEATKEIDDYVQSVRLDPAIRGSYMTLGDRFDREKRDGKEELLAELVCRKLRKGKSLEDIVDELETEESLIAPIYDIAVKHAPEYDVDEVLKELRGERITAKM